MLIDGEAVVLLNVVLLLPVHGDFGAIRVHMHPKPIIEVLKQLPNVQTAHRDICPVNVAHLETDRLCPRDKTG